MDSDVNMSDADDAELADTFTAAPEEPAKKKSKSKAKSWEDSEHFMSYNPSTSLAEDRGYSIVGGTSFAEAARIATMDLVNDDSGKGFAEAHKKGMRWDEKGKKYVQRANDEDGSKGDKMIIGESGQKIAASFKSGRFDAWKNAHKITRMPRVGESEADGKRFGGPSDAVMGGRKNGKMWHKGVQ